MAADIAVVCSLMFLAGGVSSGLSVFLLVSLAAASLVGRGRLVLLYAALATVAVLLFQIYGIFTKEFDPASIVQAGFISAGFFATAILARMLGQRVMVNEDLARRRGIALENQIRISQRVVERMQDGVLIVAVGGIVSRCNPVASGMLALSDESDVPLSSQAPILAAALQKWVAGNGEGNLHFCGADGRDLQARFEQTSSSDGEVLVFLEDVGRIKERAQQLKLASLGRLTASIAHEIRNPLSAISHAGELLREERRVEMKERLLRILNDNVIRLDRIVGDILELGRQSRAQPELLRVDEFCAGFVEHFIANENLEAGVVLLEAPQVAPVANSSHILHGHKARAVLKHRRKVFADGRREQIGRLVVATAARPVVPAFEAQVPEVGMLITIPQPLGLGLGFGVRPAPAQQPGHARRCPHSLPCPLLRLRERCSSG